MTNIDPTTSAKSILLSGHLDNVTTSPFVRFVINDFLDESTYETLRRLFPIDQLVLKLADGYTTSISLSDNSTETRKFLDSHPPWDAYRKSFESDEFVSDLIDTFADEIYSRYSAVFRPFARRRLRRPQSYETTVLFTLSTRGFFLTPHNDDKFKVVSLIHYFPVELSTGQTTGGTGFFAPIDDQKAQFAIRHFSTWSRGVRRIIPSHLIPIFESSVERINNPVDNVSAQSEFIFNQGFKRDYYSEYVSNRLIGFVKSALSFHEVDLREFPANEYRCAVVINLRLRETIFSRISAFISKCESVLVKVRDSLK